MVRGTPAGALKRQAFMAAAMTRARQRAVADRDLIRRARELAPVYRLSANPRDQYTGRLLGELADRLDSGSET